MNRIEKVSTFIHAQFIGGAECQRVGADQAIRGHVRRDWNTGRLSGGCEGGCGCKHRDPMVRGGLSGRLEGTCVFASSFSVSPTRIPLSGKNSAVIVRLLNNGDEPVTVQAHIVAWTLSENKLVYHDSDDVLLNPPIFTLEPDQAQLMQLGLRRPRAEGNEIAYRLIVDEVPPPPKPGLSLRRLSRISVPIFVEPQGGARNQVDWKAELVPGGGMKITATNKGNVHVQIKRLDLLPEGSTDAPSSKKMLDYLFPGMTGEWVFEEEKIWAPKGCL